MALLSILALLHAQPAFAASNSDDFNRADNADLGTDWAGLLGNCKIVTNTVQPTTTGTECAEGFGAGTTDFTDDHSSQVTLSTFNSAAESGIGVIVRAVSNTFYACYANRNAASTTTVIGEWTAGVFASLTSENSTTWAATDTIKLKVIGSTLTCYRNGAQLLTTTDATITTGQPGIYAYVITSATTTTIFDDWAGSDEVASSTRRPQSPIVF